MHASHPRKASIILALLLFTTCINASCKSYETDPYSPHSDELSAQRLFRVVPKSPISPAASDTLTVMTYNIQSGLSLDCVQNQQTQAELFKGSHFHAAQEVDQFVDLHCNCDQPQVVADATGKTIYFLRTISYRTGRYGHMAGTVYPIEEVRFQMYNSWVEERRGILALRTFPPQLKGRGMWFVETHLQYSDSNVRANQARELVAFVQNLTTYYPNYLYVVPGDYYTSPGEEGYKVLSAYFQNAWLVAHGLDNCNTYPSNNPVNFFDHIWFKVPSDLQVEITDAHHISTTASDHVPVIVTFAFPGINPPAADPITLELVGGTSQYWIGLYVRNDAPGTQMVEVHDSSVNTFYPLSKQTWGAYVYSSSRAFTLPITVRLTSTSGVVLTLNNIITSFTTTNYNTRSSYSSGSSPSTPAPSTPAPSTPAPSTPSPSTPAPSTPAPNGGITITAHPSVSSYWFAFKVAGSSPAATSAFLASNGGSYVAMQSTDYGYFALSPTSQLVAPLSIRLATSGGATLDLTNIITTITPSAEYKTGRNF